MMLNYNVTFALCRITLIKTYLKRCKTKKYWGETILSPQYLEKYWGECPHCPYRVGAYARLQPVAGIFIQSESCYLKLMLMLKSQKLSKTVVLLFRAQELCTDVQQRFSAVSQVDKPKMATKHAITFIS